MAVVGPDQLVLLDLIPTVCAVRWLFVLARSAQHTLRTLQTRMAQTLDRVCSPGASVAPVVCWGDLQHDDRCRIA